MNNRTARGRILEDKAWNTKSGNARAATSTCARARRRFQGPDCESVHNTILRPGSRGAIGPEGCCQLNIVSGDQYLRM
jgi:hypothetical protein